MRTGNSKILSLILSKGADVHVKGFIGVTALSIAARSGDLEAVKRLIGKGADPNSTDAIGCSSLFAATTGQNPEVVRFLLQNGADVNAVTSRLSGAAVRTVNNIKNGPTNNSNVTALHNAAAFGPVKSVRYLLAAGANVNARDSRNLVPLSFALAGEYPSLEIVRTLIRAGADVNIADSSGDTPLDWAGKFGYPDHRRTESGRR
jgi:ankyrin repeat protein